MGRFLMATANVIPLRPHVNVGALLEAAEASGLPDEVIALMIERLFPESLVAVAPEPLVRRAVATTGPRPRLHVVAVVDDEPDDEPAWPPPPIEGDAVELPGFETVPERQDRRPSWTG
jgi:hypothetical protein